MPTIISKARRRDEHNIEGRLDQHLGGLHTPSDTPHADIKICMLIDGHALIQSFGCQTLDDLATVFMQIATLYFGEHITIVDVILDRYIGKIKELIRSKRVGKQKPSPVPTTHGAPSLP